MRLLGLAFLLIILSRCTNIENASPSDRGSFIRSYEGPSSYVAATIEPTSDGYIILGTMEIQEDSVITVAIKTDKSGAQVGPPSYFPNARGKAIKSFNNSTFHGYIIVGDSIKINPSASQGGNIEVSSMHMIFVDENLQPVGSYTLKDTTASVIKTDFRSSALTVTEDGKVVVLGTFEADNERQKPFIIVLNNNLTVDWSNRYSILDLDYVNGRSVYCNGGKIIWASSILKQQGSFTTSYISIPYVEGSLSFSNYSILGEDRSKTFVVNDITPSYNPALGFGIIGTYGETDDTRKNMFFSRVMANGSIIKEDTLFVDAILSKTSSNTSMIEDTGDAITHSSDGGYVLAGTILTTPEKGAGERDIFIVKVDGLGEILWGKTLGGIGDETVTTVIETEDNGILICGTNTIGNYSSIFLIKTDSKGELKD